MQNKAFTLILAASAVIVLIISTLLAFPKVTKKEEEKTIPNNKPYVLINNKKINIEIADSNIKHQLGLSGRKELSKDSGMLFIFPKDSYPLFWMKDMNFPLDLIWISDEKIVWINKNVPLPPANTRDENLKIYQSPKPVNYVLEINANQVDEFLFTTGMEVKFVNFNFDS